MDSPGEIVIHTTLNNCTWNRYLIHVKNTMQECFFLTLVVRHPDEGGICKPLVKCHPDEGGIHDISGLRKIR